MGRVRWACEHSEWPIHSDCNCVDGITSRRRRHGNAFNSWNYRYLLNIFLYVEQKQKSHLEQAISLAIWEICFPWMNSLKWVWMWYCWRWCMKNRASIFLRLNGWLYTENPVNFHVLRSQLDRDGVATILFSATFLVFSLAYCQRGDWWLWIPSVDHMTKRPQFQRCARFLFVIGVHCWSAKKVVAFYGWMPLWGDKKRTSNGGSGGDGK